jgi:hypothetical protein
MIHVHLVQRGGDQRAVEAECVLEELRVVLVVGQPAPVTNGTSTRFS